MPANTTPIFPITANVSWGTVLTTANTAKDGTGTVVVLFTAGSFGSRIDQIKVRAIGSNIATVLRLFVNNGLDPTTAGNNALAHEVSIPATTLSETSALADNDIVIAKNSGEVACPIPYLPAGYKITATIGTTIAAGIRLLVFGGDY